MVYKRLKSQLKSHFPSRLTATTKSTILAPLINELRNLLQCFRLKYHSLKAEFQKLRKLNFWERWNSKKSLKKSTTKSSILKFNKNIKITPIKLMSRTNLPIQAANRKAPLKAEYKLMMTSKRRKEPQIW